jgi:hypothetical protein
MSSEPHSALSYTFTSWADAVAFMQANPELEPNTIIIITPPSGG